RGVPLDRRRLESDASLKPVHSWKSPYKVLAHAVEEDDYLKASIPSVVEIEWAREGCELNASLAHSERISALAEVEKGEEGTSRLREESLKEQGASLPLSEWPIESEAVNQLSGLGLSVSEGCFGKAYEQLSFDGISVAGREELIPGLLAKTDPTLTTLYGLVSEATEVLLVA
ncbi:hypothetical protein Tco_1423491, partial [Tanacetum coccineum]